MKRKKLERLIPLNPGTTVVGANMRKYRLRDKVDQVILAKELGVSQSALSRYERGDSEPSLGVVLNFCLLFRITPDDLLGFEKND